MGTEDRLKALALTIQKKQIYHSLTVKTFLCITDRPVDKQDHIYINLWNYCQGLLSDP